MQDTTLAIPQEVYEALVAHLLPGTPAPEEEAAFVYAKAKGEPDKVTFEFVESTQIRAWEFAMRSSYGLELSNEARARVIKRAHDLDASIIELHSHPSGPASFSWSDTAGFREFVPHVWWRLQGRPYAAVLLTPEGCDALAWIRDCHTPVPLRRIIAGRRIIHPTCWTAEHWSEIGNGYATL
jgi:proteasome lid subunit RPN8/RPN11